MYSRQSTSHRTVSSILRFNEEVFFLLFPKSIKFRKRDIINSFWGLLGVSLWIFSISRARCLWKYFRVSQRYQGDLFSSFVPPISQIFHTFLSSHTFMSFFFCDYCVIWTRVFDFSSSNRTKSHKNGEDDEKRHYFFNDNKISRAFTCRSLSLSLVPQ